MGNRNLLLDACHMVAISTQSIVDDDFNRLFKRHKYKRNTNLFLRFLSVFIRFGILFPIRVLILLIFILPLTLLILFFPSTFILFYFKFLSFVIGLNITNIGNKTLADKPRVYVANHSSFLDYIVLSSYKFSHSVIAQNNPGIFKFFFDIISRANGSISFERNDKSKLQTLKDSIQKLSEIGNKSLLIFPESMCLNNKCTSFFFNGAFDLNIPVVPVAIKYDSMFLSPIWKKDMLFEIIYLMSRWRIDVLVNWMEPLEIMDGENTFTFASRVKHIISESIGLENSLWNASLLLPKEPKLSKRFIELHQGFKKIYLKTLFNTNLNGNEIDKTPSDYLDHYYPEKDLKLVKTPVFFNSFNYGNFFLEINKESLRSKTIQ